MRLGKPAASEERDYRKIVVNDNVEVYVHRSLQNLSEPHNPAIDVKQRLWRKVLVLTGVDLDLLAKPKEIRLQ